MADTPTRLADFFAADARAFSRQPLPVETSEAVQEDLGITDRAALQGFAFGDLMATLYQALDIPLEDILRSAWSSLIELQEYRDAQKHPPEESNKVRFGKYRITSTHHPKVTILINDQEVVTLTFDLRLTLKITTTTLLVRAGRIWRAQDLECQGEAALSYRGFSLMKKKTQQFTLPGAIDFEDGVPIPPLPKAVG